MKKYICTLLTDYGFYIDNKKVPRGTTYVITVPNGETYPKKEHIERQMGVRFNTWLDGHDLSHSRHWKVEEFK